jgi:hypothetical protein
MSDIISRSLAELRAALHADGANLVVDELQGGTLRLRLVMRSEACLECVMPGEVLEQIALNSARESGLAVQNVLIDDPRVRR